MNEHIIKCTYCGKFVGHKDLQNGSASCIMIYPDSEFTDETYEVKCKKCTKEENMNRYLIILNGYPRSGKDSFIDFCMDNLEDKGVSSSKHSTIDTVKRIAKEMGWNGEKTPEMRNFLSEMKDLYTKYFDGPLNEIKRETMRVNVLFTCMREPDEIEKTKKWAISQGINCIRVLVRGDNEERNHGSHSDQKVLDAEYDSVVSNYYDLEYLKETAEIFLYNHNILGDADEN
jgi:hypothetical protein